MPRPYESNTLRARRGDRRISGRRLHRGADQRATMAVARLAKLDATRSSRLRRWGQACGSAVGSGGAANVGAWLDATSLTNVPPWPSLPMAKVDAM
jgi:hypothetical protein